MGKHKKNKPSSPMDAPAVQAALRRHGSPADPDGSYTGTPRQPGERPVQDADDL